MVLRSHILTAMSTSNANEPLLEFFSRFNFIEYTYDPNNPPFEEFKRLCEARRWGASKIRKHETVFLLAVERQKDLGGSPAGPNVTRFFREYEYHLFTYDMDAPAQSEFQRLVGLRRWGERNLLKVTRRFNKAVTLDARGQSVHGAPESTTDVGAQEVDLLSDWLRQQECRGYRYLGGLPELEFRELTRAKRREWNEDRRERGLKTDTEEWKEDPEFMELRTEFYEVVEKAFNSLLDRFCAITGFTPWQVLAGLYGPAQGVVGLHDQGQGNIGLHNQGQESFELYVQGQEGIGKTGVKKVCSTGDLVKL